MRNIADGHGTALDAGKAIRDMGWGLEDVQREGVSTKGSIARDGLGIAALTDSVFQLVVDDMIPQAYAAEIGRELTSPDKQRQAAKAVEGASNMAQVQSIVRQVKSAPERVEREQTLWGEETSTQSLYLERAKVEDGIAKRAGRDRRLFKTLTEKSGQAERVEGTRINVIGSKAEMEAASDLGMVLGTWRDSPGPVKDALDEAALAYANSPRKGADLAAAVEAAIERIRSVDWRTGAQAPEAPEVAAG
jgi:hypothetical protein